MHSCSLTLNRYLALAVVLALPMMIAPRAHAQPGWVLSHQKISDTEGGFTGTLDDYVRFAISASVILGDLNGDGVVGVKDLLLLLGAWGKCDDCNDCPADLDDDCSVGVKDLLILLGNWG